LPSGLLRCADAGNFSLPPASAAFPVYLFVDPEDGGGMFLRNVRLSQVHSATTQETMQFIFVFRDVAPSSLNNVMNLWTRRDVLDS
jgi:hypothetical protein